MRRWLYPGILGLLLLAPAGAGAGEGTEFAFVFECDRKKDILCLTHEGVPGRGMILLGEGSHTCPADTGTAVEFQQGMKTLLISTVDVARCRDRRRYFLSYDGKPAKDYLKRMPRRIADARTIERVDAAVKAGNLYSDANRYFRKTLSRKPLLFAPIPGNDALLVAQYVTDKPKGPGEKYGPVYLYVDGEVREIAGEAFLGSFFTLNGRHYLTLRQGCWQGCGNVGDVLVEVTDKGFRKVVEDRFFAS